VPRTPPGKLPVYFTANKTAGTIITNNGFVPINGLTLLTDTFSTGTSFDGNKLTIGTLDAGMWSFAATLIVTTEELVIYVYKNGSLALRGNNGFLNEIEYGRYAVTAGNISVVAGDEITFHA